MASRGRLIWSQICRGSWGNGLLPCCDLSKLFPVDRLNPNKMATGQMLSSGLHNRIYDAAVATPVFSNVYTEILVVRERLFNDAFKYLLSDFFWKHYCICCNEQTTGCSLFCGLLCLPSKGGGRWLLLPENGIFLLNGCSFSPLSPCAVHRRSSDCWGSGGVYPNMNWCYMNKSELESVL